VIYEIPTRRKGSELSIDEQKIDMEGQDLPQSHGSSEISPFETNYIDHETRSILQ